MERRETTSEAALYYLPIRGERVGGNKGKFVHFNIIDWNIIKLILFAWKPTEPASQTPQISLVFGIAESTRESSIAKAIQSKMQNKSKSKILKVQTYLFSLSMRLRRLFVWLWNPNMLWKWGQPWSLNKHIIEIRLKWIFTSLQKALIALLRCLQHHSLCKFQSLSVVQKCQRRKLYNEIRDISIIFSSFISILILHELNRMFSS